MCVFCVFAEASTRDAAVPALEGYCFMRGPNYPVLTLVFLPWNASWHVCFEINWRGVVFPAISSPGTHGTTQPLGAAVMKKQAIGTFGRPVEALRNDPAKFLKRGAKTHTDPGEARPAVAKESVFSYPGKRCHVECRVQLPMVRRCTLFERDCD